MYSFFVRSFLVTLLLELFKGFFYLSLSRQLLMVDQSKDIQLEGGGVRTGKVGGTEIQSGEMSRRY